MARIGCDWPDFSGVTDWNNGLDWIDWMEDVHCNIALGAWYYYYNATGNGNPPCYIHGYCTGSCAAAGNLVIGLLSHLNGPDDPYTNRDNYIDDIKSWFDNMIIPSPSPHPFDVTLTPAPELYCE